MVQEGIAYSSSAKEAHSMKLEIMIDYFLDSNNDEILVDNELTLGHLSLDEIEVVYFLKFSMLKILKISKDFATIVFHGSAWQNSDNAKRISSTDAWLTVSGIITYNDLINFRDESVTTMVSEKRQYPN